MGAGIRGKWQESQCGAEVVTGGRALTCTGAGLERKGTCPHSPPTAGVTHPGHNSHCCSVSGGRPRRAYCYAASTPWAQESLSRRSSSTLKGGGRGDGSGLGE